MFIFACNPSYEGFRCTFHCLLTSNEEDDDDDDECLDPIRSDCFATVSPWNFSKTEWWLQEFLFRHQTGIELGRLYEP